MIAAPAADVMMAIVCGYLGSGFLCAGSNRPSLESFSFSCSNATYKSPAPSAVSALQ